MKRIVLCWGIWLTAAVCFAATDDSSADWKQNWPQWRGPLANGVAPLANPPIHWDENTNIKWKINLSGDSNATPVVWGDQIFLVNAIKTDRSAEPAPDAPAKANAPKARFNTQRPTHFYQFIVMCLDRRTGETRWQHVAKEEVPHEGHHPDGSFASASPMTDGKHVYVSFGSRGVYCYDMQGNQKWSRDLGRMTIFNTFGEGCSPVVHGNSVIVNWDHQAGSFVICLDALTGETKWKVGREETQSWATPLVVEQKALTQVIINGSKRVRSYNLKTGELIWACGGQVLSPIPCPVTDGKLAFAMTGFMGSALFAIPLDANGDITNSDKVAWKRKQPGTPYVPSPLLYDEAIYFTGSNKGILSVIDAKTGEPIVERQRLQGIDNIYASPTGAADRIYFTSREGNTVVIKRLPEPAQPSTGDDSPTSKEPAKAEILATNKLDDRFDASPVLVDNQIILRGSEHVYCISAE